jgi:hypothetical protein
MGEPTATEERLHVDAFPASVYAAHVSGHPQICRVFVTNRRVVAYMTTATGVIEKLLDEEYTSEPPTRNRGTFGVQLHLTTAGGIVHVTKAGGCGCGSSLRALSAPVGW